MNGKKLSYAQYYTYEARKKDVRWLHRTIELLHQQPELGKYDEEGELFTHETVELAIKLLELMEIEQPPSNNIIELYNLLKFYKSVRNSYWDEICEYVENWHWVSNIWNDFAGILELDLWNGIECNLYSIAQPLIVEGKLIRYCPANYGHVWLQIEPII